MRFWSCVGCLLTVCGAAAAKMPGTERYPYGSREFQEFVTDSYRANHAGETRRFYVWMDAALARATHGTSDAGFKTWTAWAASAKRDSEGGTARERARKQMSQARWLWRTVKTQIPNFSLERGYEFADVPSAGRRQCLLQSVLIASLLQRAGADTGVAMVYRSDKGQISNNGHVVALLKLPTGNDVVVDASGDDPFIRQQGLFAGTTSASVYRYVDPVYAPGSSEIARYHDTGTGAQIAPSAVRTLDARFILGQFRYYRGEETPGGLFADQKTTAGLTHEIDLLKISMATCPTNPLPAYMLGRVYLRLDRDAPARTAFKKALTLYNAAGWLPPGMREVVALAR